MNEKLSQSFRAAGFTEQEVNSLMTYIAKMRAEEKTFQKEFSDNWGTAFVASECLYAVISQAVELCEKYVDDLSGDEKDEKINTYTALSTLQKRASQEYLEILTLIKNGFSDGAFARWRSMHELSVISSFILKYGETVAEQFIAASDSQDRYDWAMASGAFRENKRHVTFGDILKLTDMNDEVWKDNYTVANQTVHASPQGTFGRLGSPDGQSRSGYGIAAPAIQSANTLALVSSMLVSVLPDEKAIEKMSLSAKMLEELIEIYYSTHEKLFGEEE